ncbi:MAG TPA: hypothetical protein VIF62_36780 [Labilithrix sp.]|jgi:hypothetical protein
MCANDDLTCQLTCADTPGADTLGEVGDCATNNCANECPPPDGGDGLGDAF